jgi:hypothetical protein
VPSSKGVLVNAAKAPPAQRDLMLDYGFSRVQGLECSEPNPCLILLTLVPEEGP